jgi:hypothetical protein
MKRFDFTKPKFSHLFQVGVLLTNYLHYQWMDFIYKVIGDYNFDPIAQGWVGDYLCISLNLQKFVILGVRFYRVFKYEIKVLGFKGLY